MADFSKEDFQEKGKYFPEGVHKVKISEVEFGETAKGQEYVEFSVIGENGEEGSARLWFTTPKATNFTLNTIRNILVHNTQEKNKEAMKEKFNAVTNTKELDDFCQALRGKDAWYSVVRSGEYTDNFGNLKPNFNRNIWGHEYTLPKQTAKEFLGGEEVAKDGDYPF